MYTFIPQMISSRKKKSCNPNAERASAIIGISFAAIASISGLYIKTKDSYSGDFSFWDWLLNSNASVESTFAGDQAKNLVVNWKGEWLFATGDESERASTNFDDSSWAKIKVPSYWEDSGFKHYNGFAWYRRTFALEEKDINKQLFASLGKIDDVDEVFVNGKRIGGLGIFPPNYSSAWNKQRTYALPKGSVHAGENLIAVRVFDAQQGGGIQKGKIGLYSSNLPQALIDLQGEWLFATGEHPNWKNTIADASQAKAVQVPMIWEVQGFENFDGIAWYQKTFEQLDISEEQNLMLIMGKIDDTDEVFLNGNPVGHTGNLNNGDRSVNSNYYNAFRVYEFPSALLQDLNILAVRVHDSSGNGGIYSGPLYIMSKTAYLEHQKMTKEASKWNFNEIIDWLLGRS